MTPPSQPTPEPWLVLRRTDAPSRLGIYADGMRIADVGERTSKVAQANAHAGSVQRTWKWKSPSVIATAPGRSPYPGGSYALS